MNDFGGDFDTPGAFVEYPVPFDGRVISAHGSFFTVRDAVNACAANKYCAGKRRGWASEGLSERVSECASGRENA